MASDGELCNWIRGTAGHVSHSGLWHRGQRSGWVKLESHACRCIVTGGFIITTTLITAREPSRQRDLWRNERSSYTGFSHT